MKKIIKHTLFIISFLLSAQLFAQNLPKVSIAADTTAIKIGEQIALTLHAETDTLSFVDFPEMAKLGDMEVVSSTSIDTVTAKPVRRLLKKYYITQWDSGQYVVPPIDVRINERIFKTDSLQIAVQSVAVDTTKQALYGFKETVKPEGYVAKSERKQIHWWWFLALLLLIPLVWFIRKKRQEYIEKHRPLTPYEQAKMMLDKLRQDDVLFNQEVDRFYLQLTDILKEYLENELHLSAKEKISSQLIEDLKKYRFENGKYFDAETLRRLQKTFERADLAKFAQMRPPAEEVTADFAAIQGIIDESHQVISSIEDENAEQLAAIKADRRRNRRIVYSFAAAAVLAFFVAGAYGYIYLGKKGALNNLGENLSTPEWVYSEYGASPSVGLTTPHILNSYNALAYVKDEKLKAIFSQIYDETSLYADNNLIRGYAIAELNLDFVKESENVSQVAQQLIDILLQQINATNIKYVHEEMENGVKYFGEFTADIGAFSKERTYEFEAKIYPSKTNLRMVLGVYFKGDNDNKKLIDRTLSSVELVK